MFHILVIDDDEQMQFFLNEALHRQGYAVTLKKTAEEGLQTLKADSADLILLDIRLPGMSGLEAVEEIHTHLNEQFGEAGVGFDRYYVCPHHPEDNCECRKPLPGLLERAAAEHGIDLARSFVVGDRYLDVALAHATGGRGIMLMSGFGRGEYEYHRHEWSRQPDHVAENLQAAAEIILKALI